MFGLLNLKKPSGVTSRDVVNRVQRLVKPHKVGHAGTLDPLASGVLVVCLGPATRLIEYVQRMPKRYLATFLLGRQSETEDIEGPVTELVDPPVPTEAQIRASLPDFIGCIQQLPPAFSALKVEGKRAYEMARQGEIPDLKPRPIEVHSIDLIEYSYPEITLDIRCGSGTYVRSLGRDIARALGTEAVMSALSRTEIGPFHVSQALCGDDITPQSIDRAFVPPQSALGTMPTLAVSEQEEALLRNGRQIQREVAYNLPSGQEEVALLTSTGRLLAIVVPAGPTHWQPRLVFG
ncbi:MAG: tRNA pseudouridine(55) synthase TruB [Planctomycetales bacterium]|nr:tRNA pseudouridine(55) synthase TruB [Planctomycetales bacterium]